MHPPGSVRAPEIALPGLTWFNTPAPLPLARLRGRLVILDFWTYCCVNCLQLLPALKRVEAGFPDAVVVIGVHSPKFDAEKAPDAVAAAIARSGIAHPVVHDPGFALWSRYTVRGWPTLVFISPDGYVIGEHAGEIDPDTLFETVGETIANYARHGRVWPADLAPPAPAPAATRFRFPAKLKPLSGVGWALADSGHHQIVVLDADGREAGRVGSGTAGFADGAVATAAFNAPQGVAADDDAIYVADTGNHALRRIDRMTGAVTTLAGDGSRGRALAAGPARAAALASPWDVELDGRRLIFANAGTHQLGAIALDGGTLSPLAGEGTEGLRDGPAREAFLAQPSGLALDARGRALYFVDAETSSVRRLDLTAGRVDTLAGNDLFDFGHRNGALAEARFQHPLGLAWQDHPGGARLLVADSFNGRIRRIELGPCLVADFGDGYLCRDPVCLPAGEPAGVAVAADGRILLVDTNNHRVLVYDESERSYRSWAG